MRRTQSRAWDENTYTASWLDAVFTIKTWITPHILANIDIPNGGTVLECGIGSGKWSAGFAMLDYRVYAMDNSRAMIRRAYANFPNLVFQGIVKDVRDPPLIAPPVDLLVSEGLVEHFRYDEERKQVLTNFYDAVKGYVSIIVPYKSEEEDEIYYTAKKLKDELEEVGFHLLDGYCLVFRAGDGKTLRRLVGVNAKK